MSPIKQLIIRFHEMLKAPDSSIFPIPMKFVGIPTSCQILRVLYWFYHTNLAFVRLLEVLIFIMLRHQYWMNTLPWLLIPWGWFNIKMPSYQYRKSHCGDKTVVRSSYLHNGISYTGKMTSLYWIGALASCQCPGTLVCHFTVMSHEHHGILRSPAAGVFIQQAV